MERLKETWRVRKGSCLLTVAAVYWGITTVLMKHILFYMNSPTYLMLRFLSAAILVLAVYGKRLAGISLRTFMQGLVLGILLVVPMELTVLGLNYTSASNSVFISQMSIVFVPVCISLLNKKVPSKNLLLSILITLTGLYVFSHGNGGSFNIGDGITFCSALLNTACIMTMNHFVRDGDAELLGALQIVIAAILSLAAGIFLYETPVLCRTSILIIILTGVIGTGIAYIVQAVGQKYSRAVTVPFIQMLTPVFGMIGAALRPDHNQATELITFHKSMGSIIILFGLAWYMLFENKIDTYKKFTPLEARRKHEENYAL